MKPIYLDLDAATKDELMALVSMTGKTNNLMDKTLRMHGIGEYSKRNPKAHHANKIDKRAVR